MPGRVLQPTAGVEGAVDYELPTGEVISVPEASLPPDTEYAGVHGVLDPSLGSSDIPQQADVLVQNSAPQVPAAGMDPRTDALPSLDLLTETGGNLNPVAAQEQKQQVQSELDPISKSLLADGRAADRVTVPAAGAGSDSGPGFEVVTKGGPRVADENVKTGAADSFLSGFDKQAEASVGFESALEDASGKRTDILDNADFQAALVDQEQRDLKEEFEAEEKKSAEKLQALETAAAEEIDPNAYWNDRGTVGKISAIAGLIIGGFAAAFTGSKQNPGIVAMNAAIERDLQAQRANSAKAEKAAGTQRSKMREATEAYEGEDAKLAAKRVGHYQAAQRQLDVLTAGLQDEEKLARVKTLQAGLEQEKDKAMVDLQQMQREHSLKVAKVNARGRKKVIRFPSGAEVDMSNPVKAAKEVEAFKKLGMIPADFAPGTGGGEDLAGIPGTEVADSQVFNSLGKADKAKARKAVVLSQRMVDLSNKALSLREKFGNEVWNREAIAEAEAIQNEQTALFREVNNLGVPSAAETAQALAANPAATDISAVSLVTGGLADPKAARLKANARLAESGLANTLSVFGLRPAGAKSNSASKLKR